MIRLTFIYTFINIRIQYEQLISLIVNNVLLQQFKWNEKKFNSLLNWINIHSEINLKLFNYRRRQRNVYK